MIFRGRLRPILRPLARPLVQRFREERHYRNRIRQDRRRRKEFAPSEAFLAEHGALVDSLRNDGVLLLPGLMQLSDGARQEMAALLDRDGTDQVFERTSFGRLINLADDAIGALKGDLAAIREYSANVFLCTLVEHAMGYTVALDNVVMYQTHHQDLPFSSYLWHHDSGLWRYKAQLYINDVPADMGPLWYMKGSHLKPRKQLTYTESRVDPAKFMEYEQVTITGNSGDVVLFNTNGLHRAGIPAQGQQRMVLQNWYA
jgi:hypothetical protein